jgi:hypothetical protein
MQKVILVLEIVKTVASLQEFFYYYPHKKYCFTPYPSNGSVNKSYSAGLSPRHMLSY